QIEPMVRAARHAQQIARLDFDRNDGSLLRVNVKQTAAANDKAHLVFIVPVLDVELRQHCVETGRGRTHVDHVRRDVAALCLELFDFGGVGREHLIGGRVERDTLFARPTFVVDAQSLEVARHFVVIGDRPSFSGNSYCCHVMPRSLPIASKRNSRISTCRFASSSVPPQVYNPCLRMRNPCAPGDSRSMLSTCGAAAAQSCVFSMIGSISRCWCVATPSRP